MQHLSHRCHQSLLPRTLSPPRARLARGVRKAVGMSNDDFERSGLCLSSRALSRALCKLAQAALSYAIDTRKPPKGLLVHSDRGKQYAAKGYQELLTENDLISSMSRLSNCYDNAVMESFFHSLKTELIHHEDYRTRNDARASLFDYVELFYNRRRKHSTIDYQSPKAGVTSTNAHREDGTSLAVVALIQPFLRGSR